jgi:hypothetical protein
MFGLRLRDPRYGTALRFWNPEPPANELRVVCLGHGERMFPQLGDERDLFGVVDAVLNFAETNATGVAAYAERPLLGGMFVGF